MDYGRFEQQFRRRAAGQALLREIGEERRRPPAAFEGRLPDAEEIDRLYEEWLPQGFFNCLRATHPACGGPDGCGERCTSAYWRRHSEEVATMLQRLARHLGEHDELWYVTGLLHDLDYLRGPHHDSKADSAKAHPIAVSRWMLDFGMPPVAVLAVLQHSPHLGIPADSRLGHALIACDEHATMTADGQVPSYPEDIPRDILDCLGPSASEIDGFVRSDMLDRATAALRGLAA